MSAGGDRAAADALVEERARLRNMAPAEMTDDQLLEEQRLCSWLAVCCLRTVSSVGGQDVARATEYANRAYLMHDEAYRRLFGSPGKVS